MTFEESTKTSFIEHIKTTNIAQSFYAHVLLLLQKAILLNVLNNWYANYALLSSIH